MLPPVTGHARGVEGGGDEPEVWYCLPRRRQVPVGVGRSRSLAETLPVEESPWLLRHLLRVLERQRKSSSIRADDAREADVGELGELPRAELGHTPHTRQPGHEQPAHMRFGLRLRAIEAATVADVGVDCVDRSDGDGDAAYRERHVRGRRSVTWLPRGVERQRLDHRLLVPIDAKVARGDVAELVEHRDVPSGRGP